MVIVIALIALAVAVVALIIALKRQTVKVTKRQKPSLSMLQQSIPSIMTM